MRLLSLSFVALLALAGSSCNGPCESLAEKICSCEANQIEEAGCIEEVRAAMDRFQPDPTEEQICDQLIDDCTCEALENEQFDKCGLSKGVGE